MMVLVSSCRTPVAPRGNSVIQPNEIYPASTYGQYRSASLYHKGALAYLATQIAHIPGATYTDSSTEANIREDRILLHQYFADSVGLTGSDLALADSVIDTTINDPVNRDPTGLLGRVSGLPLSPRERSFVNRCIAIDSTPESTLDIMGKLDSVNAIYADWQSVSDWSGGEGHDGHLSEGFIWLTGSSIDFWDEMYNYYPSAPMGARNGKGGAVVQATGRRSRVRPQSPVLLLMAVADVVGFVGSASSGGNAQQNVAAGVGCSVGAGLGDIPGLILGGAIGIAPNLGNGNGGSHTPSPGDRDATNVSTHYP